MHNQVGLTYANEACNNKFYDAVGSLDLDYERWTEEEIAAGSPPPARQEKMDESEFNKIVPNLSGMYIYDLLSNMKNEYDIGRTRIMVLESKQCLTWHQDSTPRLHIPIITHDGCKMVWENTTASLMPGLLYWADTRHPHTAFNGSYKQRIHLVATVKE